MREERQRFVPDALIPNLQAATVNGKIVFEGRDMLKISMEEMSHIRGGKITMIFQEHMGSLNPVLTIEIPVTEAMQLHKGIPRGNAITEAESFFSKVGISDPPRRLSQYPHHSSWSDGDNETVEHIQQ